jgi:hypothetical protein
MHSTIRHPKQERRTFRRHFPIWFSVNLRPWNPVVYLRIGDRIDFWVLDSLLTLYAATKHGQKALRGATRRQHAAFAIGCWANQHA